MRRNSQSTDSSLKARLDTQCRVEGSMEEEEEEEGEEEDTAARRRAHNLTTGLARSKLKVQEEARHS
jgi:hypothetical protein